MNQNDGTLVGASGLETHDNHYGLSSRGKSLLGSRCNWSDRFIVINRDIVILSVSFVDADIRARINQANTAGAMESVWQEDDIDIALKAGWDFFLETT